MFNRLLFLFLFPMVAIGFDAFQAGDIEVVAGGTGVGAPVDEVGVDGYPYATAYSPSGELFYTAIYQWELGSCDLRYGW